MLLGSAAILDIGFAIYLEWLLTQPRPVASQAAITMPVLHKPPAQNVRK